jgi:hypothetical protein
MIVERGGFVASLKVRDCVPRRLAANKQASDSRSNLLSHSQEDKISALRITENALNVLGSLVEKHKQGTHESVYQPKQR